MHEILGGGLGLAALSIGQLWWAYIAIGGTASPTDVAGFMSGEVVPDALQYDLVAQALNERLGDLGMGHPIPYSASS